ncbi:MAG: methylated-DNA--[protein]-cysteine S-methyltransferase [Candidatus Odinarchaeota archaeon]
MDFLFYTTYNSPFDTFTITWKEPDSILKIQRIFLSDPETNSETKARESFKHIKIGSNSSIKLLAEQIQYFLRGERVELKLDLLDFNRCLEIQKKVLLAEYKIPRGRVSTYKRIANHIGISKGARVVGNALARNPFPIVIPCHRAIKTNGELGGYQGGIEMKQKLLEMEGVKISEKGRVITNKFYY